MKGVLFQSKLLEPSKILIHRHLSPHSCLPSRARTWVIGEVASLSVLVNGEEGSLLLPHKNSKLTWLSLHLTRHDTTMCQRQIRIRSSLSAPSSIPSKQWIPRPESADYSRIHQHGKVTKIHRSLLPGQKGVKQSDNVTK